MKLTSISNVFAMAGGRRKSDNFYNKHFRKLVIKQKLVEVMHWFLISFLACDVSTSCLKNQLIIINSVNYILIKNNLFVNKIVFSRCKWFLAKDGVPKKFSQKDCDRLVSNVIEPMASDGLRTICLAYKDYVTKSDDIQENQVHINVILHI